MSVTRKLHWAMSNSRVAFARASQLSLSLPRARRFAYELLVAPSRPTLERLAASSDTDLAASSDSLNSGGGGLGSLVYQYTPGFLASQLPAALEGTLDELLHVPKKEVGGIAICASIKNEARFITEWLLYNRANGVDRFYLYDTGSTDNTLEVLQPWMETGVVVLHKFKADQGGYFQLNSLETCSRTYGLESDWILDCDVDEFYVATPALTSHQRLPAATTFEMPDQPLRRLLFDNYIYSSVDAIAASRITWKNAGFARLPDNASVLASQTLRDIYHAIPYGKLEYTKSLLRSAKTPGWYIPGAHFLRNDDLRKEKARIVTADGELIPVIDLKPGNANPGTLYKGHNTFRVFEPLVMYHYNCLDKLKNAQKVRKGGWRDQAGEAGCKSFELYQPDDEWVPMHEKGGFYGGAVKDMTMSNSWYGQHLPGLIRLVLQRADQIVAEGNVRQAKLVDPHPALVAEWVRKGKNPQNGMDIVEPDKKEDEA
ncbi:hypothetical protein JCM3775_000007 [Rhodotorula graminis]